MVSPEASDGGGFRASNALGASFAGAGVGIEAREGRLKVTVDGRSGPRSILGAEHAARVDARVERSIPETPARHEPRRPARCAEPPHAASVG